MLSATRRTHMTESSFRGDDPMAGATVQGENNVDSATADREAAYDEPVSSAAGTVTDDNATVADSPADSAAGDETNLGPDRTSSADADVAAGYDEGNPGGV
jgi:hypothetical protein